MVTHSSPADTSLPLLVVLHGATASGKTALAIELAERFSGEIVSCDSVAVFRDLEIGTAKPTLDERARVSHHMLDVVSPRERYSAGDYSRDARTAIEGITKRNRLPIVAGGTGLYLRALLEGLFPGPPRCESLRARLREQEARRSPGYLLRLLRRLDPDSAARIHANDTPKLIRALEVTLTARQPMSAAWQAGRDRLQGYRVLKLGLDPPRAELNARIDRRAAAMFASGLLEETKMLLERYGPDSRPLASLGYKQAAMALRGEISVDEAIAAAQRGHRQYAKRQATWFRREANVHWLAGFGDDAATAAQAIAIIGHNLRIPV